MISDLMREALNSAEKETTNKKDVKYQTM